MSVTTVTPTQGQQSRASGTTRWVKDPAQPAGSWSCPIADSLSAPQFRNFKIIYRRYAGLYFCICVDVNDNNLAYLEAIHNFVEVCGRAPRGPGVPGTRLVSLQNAQTLPSPLTHPPRAASLCAHGASLSLLYPVCLFCPPRLLSDRPCSCFCL